VKIEVNYNGKEKRFGDNLAQAIIFCEELAKEGTGSDIWVDGAWYRSYVKNPYTGKFDITH
jgi:hypothetical protein